ncbi:MAG: DUF3892 domain-containing protein [Nitrososphaeraceae archaeon]|nr:DUF3892 domain-containing protein [Nitrososphaeraceae archaeon]
MDYQIVCVVKNRQGIITYVGTNDAGHRYPVETIINLMRENTFFTYEDGRKNLIHARQHPSTGHWFLTINPDDNMNENNLDFLRECPDKVT